MPGQHQEAGVLAGAIVVELGGCIVAVAEAVPFRLVVWHLGATAQIAFRETEIGEPMRDPLHMDLRALMRGAGKRETFGGEVAARTAFEQRQGLKHLA